MEIPDCTWKGFQFWLESFGIYRIQKSKEILQNMLYVTYLCAAYRIYKGMWKLYKHLV